MNKRNGFILADTVLAVVFSLACLLPASALTRQAVSTYGRARYIVEASAIGRAEMESLRSVQAEWNTVRTENWQGRIYTVHSRIAGISEQYVQYWVEVTDPDGVVHPFRRLAKSSASAE